MSGRVELGVLVPRGPQPLLCPDKHPGYQSLADAMGRVRETIADLMLHRKRVILANLDSKSVRELERPCDLAEAILESVGPLAREMRRRSR